MSEGVANWLGGSKGKKANGGGQGGVQKLSPEDDPNTIHIFTVASGHMYERLQKIMVLSMIRNTKCAPPPPACPACLSFCAPDR